MFSQFARSGGYVPLGGWIKDGNETLEDQIVYFRLIGIETTGRSTGRDDGKVIADLLVVEYSLVLFVNPIGLKHELCVPGKFSRDVAQHLGAGRAIVFGQGLGVGSWVGDDLVAFVKGLGQLECATSGESVLPIGFTLEGG